MYDISLTKEYVFLPEHLCLSITDIAEDFTLMDFFTLVKDASDEYPWLLEVLKYPTWFHELHNEILDDPSESDNHASNIEYIKVSSFLDDDEHEEIGDVHVVRSMCDIYGVGKDNGCGNTYGLSGCRVNDFKHLVIKLDPVLRNKLIKYPTLLQFMYSILWELTFFGGPSERKEKVEEIKQSVEDVKEGRVETSPMPPTTPKITRAYGLNHAKLALNFIECAMVDMDGAQLFLKKDEELKDIRNRIDSVIKALKEMVN